MNQRAPIFAALFVLALASTASADHWVCAAGDATCGGTPAYTSIQTALNAATCGETVYLKAGESFNQSAITLPNTSDCGDTETQGITVRSTGPDSNFPAAGVRVIPCTVQGGSTHGRVDSSGLNRCNTQIANWASVGSTSGSTRTIQTGANAAKDYVFKFVRFTGTYEGSGAIFEWGRTTNQTEYSHQPDGLIIDRVIMDPDPMVGMHLGFAMHGKNVVLKNSFLTNMVGDQQDTQCAAGGNGEGPFEFDNNTCIGGTEGFIMGGSDPWIAWATTAASGGTTTRIEIDTTGGDTSKMRIGDVIAMQYDPTTSVALHHAKVTNIVDVDTFDIDVALPEALVAGDNVAWGLNPKDIWIHDNYFTLIPSWRNGIIFPPSVFSAEADTSQGTLAAGTYCYIGRAVRSGNGLTYLGGEYVSSLTSEVCVNLPATGRVRIFWSGQDANATVHRIYAGPGSGLQDHYLTATGGAATTEWFDTGQAGTVGTPGAGTPTTWDIKTRVEFKNGDDSIIENNLIENNWTSGVSSSAQCMWLKSNSQHDRPVSFPLGQIWGSTDNLIVRTNWIRHCPGAFIHINSAISPVGDTTSERPKPMADLQIYENLMTDGSHTNWGGTNTYAIMHDTRLGAGFQFYRNTILNIDSNGLYSPEGVIAPGNMTWENNIGRRASLGVKTGGIGEGTATLNAQFTTYSWGGNVIASATCGNYPAGTTCPSQANFEAAFHAYGTGTEDVILNYRLADGHAYNTSGTDNGRIGADVAALATILENVQFGGPPPAQAPPKRSRFRLRSKF